MTVSNRKIDDLIPYHLDITFDIGVGFADTIAYDYYNVTDSQIRKDHVYSTGFPKVYGKLPVLPCGKILI